LKIEGGIVRNTDSIEDKKYRQGYGNRNWVAAIELRESTVKHM
jgi:hypothetical protein